MIFPQTIIRICDNSGGQYLKCIKVLKKGSYSNIGRVGELIVGSVRSLRAKNRLFSKVKKGDVVYAIIVKTKLPIKRKTGVQLSFSINAAVLVNKNFQPLASRVFGCLPRELRINKFSKLITLSNGTT